MLKQTRGAINLLLGSYKGVLKTALVGSIACTSMLLSANADTLNLDLSAVGSSGNANTNTTDINDYGNTVNLSFSGCGASSTSPCQIGILKLSSRGNTTVQDNGYLDANQIYINNSTTAADKASGKKSTVDLRKADITAKKIVVANTADGASYNDLWITGTHTSYPVDFDASTNTFDASNTIKFNNLTVASASSAPYIYARYAHLEGKNFVVDNKTSSNTGADSVIGALKADKVEFKGPNSFSIGSLNTPDLRVTNQFGKSTSYGAIASFNGSQTTNGNITVGQNVGLMVGSGADVHGGVQDTVNTGSNIYEAYIYALSLMTTNASSVNKIGTSGINAALFVNDYLTIGSGKGIVVDGETTTPHAVEANTLYIGKGSAVIYSKAISEGGMENGGTERAGISFASAGTVKYNDNSKIILRSSDLVGSKKYKIFSNATIQNVQTAGTSLKVTSINGAFTAAMADGNTSGYTDELGPSGNGIPNNSSPVFTAPPVYTPLTPQQAQNTPTINGLLNLALSSSGAQNTSGIEFLKAVLGESFAGGQEAVVSSSLATLGGSLEAGVTVGSIADKNISARTGVGSANATVLLTDQDLYNGIWLSPTITKGSFDGRMVDNKYSYGSKVSLKDITLGYDHALGNFRLGAYAQYGSGDTRGKEIGSFVKGDVDYYGFGLYGTFVKDAFKIVADLSYTHLDDDVRANVNLVSFKQLTAESTSHMIRTGVTAQYMFDCKHLYVTPHAGLRHTGTWVHDYDVKADGVKIAKITQNNVQRVTSIPVGVTLEKAFVTNDWSFKPAIDLGITFNGGDKVNKSKVRYVGLSHNATVSAETHDSRVFNASLGIDAVYKTNTTFGAGINYDKSSNGHVYNFAIVAAHKF